MKTPKEKIKDKLGKELRHLSAQDFKLLAKEEKKALKEVITEAGEDYDDWEGRTKKMFPKEVVMKPIHWRKT